MRLTSFCARIGAAQAGGEGGRAGCSKQAGREGGREGFGAPLNRREVLGSGAFSRDSGELASGRCLPS